MPKLGVMPGFMGIVHDKRQYFVGHNLHEMPVDASLKGDLLGHSIEEIDEDMERGEIDVVWV